MTVELSARTRLAIRIHDLRDRANRVGLSHQAACRNAGCSPGYLSTAATALAADPEALDRIEAIIAERERHVLAELLELHWERG